MVNSSYLQNIVTPTTFCSVIKHLGEFEELAFDTETFGLRAFHGDKIFSIILSTDEVAYYFNFINYNTDTISQHRPEHVLPREFIARLQPLFKDRLLFVHNAKFDWHMIEKEGIELDCDVWCTETMARVLYNDHMKYGLDACAERIGEKKDNAVEEYIKKHKLWEWVQIPGKKTRQKNKFYSRVPFGVIVPYGVQDAVVCFRLGKSQQKSLHEIALSTAANRAKITDVVDLEMGVTRATARVEHHGIKVDVDLINAGLELEVPKMRLAKEEFEDLTGMEFKDSNKVFAQAFTNLGFEYPQTAKGNPSFNDEVLASFDNPVARAIQSHRESEKRANTYYRSFLYWMDENHVIHPDLRQAGTATGRFSCRNPNLQNVPKGDDDGGFKIRSCFVPREDYVFVAIDYNQMEFRLMLDYAGEFELIDQIKKGFDPHTATAELVGIGRRPAKILNFGLLYGMGVAKLAETLGVSIKEAREFKRKYFSGLPAVKHFLRKSTQAAETRGYVFDWAGRRFHFNDPRFAYKAANAIIQGGCASIVKQAMVGIDVFQNEKQCRSRAVLQIHDEVLFEIHKSEIEIVPSYVQIMESVYPQKYLPLTCSVEYSEKSWGDMSEYQPNT